MYGLLDLCSLPFIPFWTRRCFGKSPHLPTKPMLLFFLLSVGLLAIDPVVSLNRVCYNFTFLFTLCYLVRLWADVPAVPTHSFVNLFCLGLLRPTFHIFTFFGLCWPKFLLCQPFHYFIPQTSSVHLLPLYLFYSHELLARSSVLLGPNYHIFTSYYFLGFLAFRPTH